MQSAGEFIDVSIPGGKIAELNDRSASGKEGIIGDLLGAWAGRHQKETRPTGFVGFGYSAVEA